VANNIYVLWVLIHHSTVSIAVEADLLHELPELEDKNELGPVIEALKFFDGKLYSI
jgi:hypothetical protein